MAIYAASAAWNGRVSIDVASAALEGWRWATSGSPWLDGVTLVWQTDDGTGVVPGQIVEADGRLVTSRTPGTVLIALLAHLLAPGDAYSVIPVIVAAVLLMSSAVVAMFLALDTLASRTVALAAAAAFALATPTWSISADALWTHTITQTGLAWVAFAASKSRWVGVGVAFGFGLLGRAHIAVVAAIVGVWVALAQRRPAIALQVGLPATAALGLYLGVNAYRYGEPTISGGYDYAAGNLTEAGSNVVVQYLQNLAGFLVSPDRGLLLWSAAAVLLVPAAVRAARGAPSWVPAMAVGGLAYTAAQLKINSFTGGEGFYGYRHGLELITCLVPLLTIAWSYVRRPLVHVAVIVLLYLQAAVIATGALVPGLWVSQEDACRSSSVLLAAAEAPWLLASLTLAAMTAAVATVKAMEAAEERERAAE